METWKLRSLHCGAVLLVASFSYLGVRMLFHPSLVQQAAEFELRKAKLVRMQELISHQDAYASEWDKIKNRLPSADPGELNRWVQDLLRYAESEKITFTRIEPQGLKEGDDGQELRLFLAYEGDIRRLIRCLYHLRQEDPFSRLLSLSMKKEEDSKSFRYELVLGKAVP